MDSKINDMYKYALKLRKDGDIDGAIKILRRLYRLNPDIRKFKNIYACLLLEKDEMKEEGINILKESLNSSNEYENLYALFNLGECYYKQFNYEKAEIYFNLFIEKINNITLNDNLKTKLNYAILHLGTIQMHNNFTDAAANFKKLLDTDFSHAALNNLITIEIREENYEEAYNYYLKLINRKNIKLDDNLKRTGLYLKYKLGLLSREDNNIYNYFYSQLISYEPNYALNYIITHHNFESIYEKSIYNKDISISDLYDSIMLIINDTKPVFYDLCCDVYIIEFNHMIGFTIIRGKEKETNIVEVSTLPNTKNILTMVPSSKNFAINIKTYDKEEEVKTKEFKRESQIDKFNRKYGMK